MMNYKEKAIEIATNGASIAFGLILFLAILVGVPAVFVGLYLAKTAVVMAWAYVTTHHGDLFFFYFMPASCLTLIVLAAVTDYREKKRKGGDA